MQKSDFKLRPIGIIKYIALTALVIFLYAFFHSYFLCLTAVIMLLFPIISICGAFYVSGRVSPELGIGKEVIRNGEEALLEIRILSPVFFPVPGAELKLSLSNDFLENKTGYSVEMPLKPYGRSALKLPLTFVELGQFTIECSKLCLKDILGLIIIRKPVGLSVGLYVLPEEGEDKLAGRADFMEGAAEVSESKHKGYDYSEVSDIREYAAGDRIRDIHWKLSAKRDELMVKVRSASAGSEMVMLFDFVNDIALSQRILELGFDFGRSFIARRLPVRLLCWNNHGLCFEEYECASENELGLAYSEIYKTGLSGHINEDAERLLNGFFPHLRAYILLGARDGEAGAWMHENGC